MKMYRLGNSDLHVSPLCLGSMTFGQQNSEDEAHQQLDMAFAQGINFIDTAEMYPVPGKPETQGRSECFIGSWLMHQDRSKIILASKVTGPSRGFNWIRGGPHAVNRENIRAALHGSLKRLQTEYLDLYQIHWPDRYVPMFGESSYELSREKACTSFSEQLEALAECVREGKIRHVGLSNETPYGVSEFVKLAESGGWPRVVSIQNPYNLINRHFEYGLSEMCRHHDVGMMAYSPLGFGMLSGKYDAADAVGRLNLFPAFGLRYRKPNVARAVSHYVALAREIGVTPAQLALAFVRTRWFVTSCIIGATSMIQLEENLQSLNIHLDENVFARIEAIHADIPNPAP
ncbi:MAG: aldo/keto reductase [Pseudomonadota bacterium]|nr:aldo/keto reductase [Pseudomonadota bacterium]